MEHENMRMPELKSLARDRGLTLSHLGGGADSTPPGRLSLITSKLHKISK